MNPIIDYHTRIQCELDHRLPSESEAPHSLHAAMRYAVLNGGKRLRPLLLYTLGTTLGIPIEKLDGPACALEFMHAYSLIHDDLPSMDDDDWRRHHLTCHKVFGEATAILAGDALQALAFACLTHEPTSLQAAQQRDMVQLLAKAVGSLGMVGGQSLDLETIFHPPTLSMLETINHLKTGALLRTCVSFSLIAGEISLHSDVATALYHSVECMGLAFQIQDDILDIIGDQKTLGKTPQNDRKQGKPTYASRVGIETATSKVVLLREAAVEILTPLSFETTSLRRLIENSCGKVG